MNFFHAISIAVVIVYIVVAVAVDGISAAFGFGWSSFCDACRELNQATGGMLALGSVALWVHIYLRCLLPKTWY